MTYLPSLIKKIDNFYSLAASLERLNRFAAPPQAWTMPDDEEYEEEDQPDGLEGEDTGLYSKVMGTADDLSNEKNSYKYEDIANEIRLIAELYKKALQINGGFAQVQNYIKRTMANIDMLIDESEGSVGDDVRNMSDDIIEEMSSDLRRRAKSTPITQQANESWARKELEDVKDKFNGQEAREEIESQKSVYEKGKPGAETGHVIVKKTAETPQKYAREIAGLKESLKTETDPANRQNIEALDSTLTQLIEQMKTVKKLEGDAKITPDDSSVESFKQATIRLDELRRQRFILRRNMNDLLLKGDKKRLIEQQEASRNTEERKWLQHKIDLLDLRLNSKLLRKRDMIKVMKAKINSTGIIDPHGDFQALTLPEATFQTLEKAYEAGSKKSITKEKYDRERTEEKGKLEGRITVPTAAPQRGGAREIVFRHDVNTKDKKLSLEKFPGLLRQLRNLNNTATADARKYIMRPKEKGDPALEKYVDAISQAIRKKDNTTKYKAITALKEAIKSTLVKSESLKGYLQVLRLAPHFKKIEESLFSIAKKQDENGNWDLTDEDMQQVVLTVSNMNRLIELYAKYYQTRGTRKFNEQPYPFFNGVVNIFEDIKKNIIPNMIKFRVNEPEKRYRVENTTDEESPEEAAQPEDETGKQRNKLMAEIIQQGLLKKSQEFDPKEKKRQYDRIRTELKGFQQGKEFVPTRSNKGGWGAGEKRYHIVDTSIFHGDPTFGGLVDLFGQTIATATSHARNRIARVREKGDPTLKPYVDAVSLAIRKRDNAKKYEAIRNLKEAVSHSLVSDEAMIGLEKTIRMEMIFRDALHRAKSISMGHKIDSAFIEETINRAKRTLALYEQQNKMTQVLFDQPALLLKRVIYHLENPTNDVRLENPPM